VLSYALAHDTGFRRDGVGSPWHEQNWIGSRKYAEVVGMAETWQRAPVVFEWFGDYDYLQSKAWSLDAAVKFMLNHHVILINDNIGRVPPEGMPQMEKLARLVLREVSHEKEAKRGGLIHVETKWANVGTVKVYHRYALRHSLVDSAGRTGLFADAKADVPQWLPGDHAVTESIEIPTTLSPGDYDLVLTLVDPDGARRPFLLAVDVPEKDGRYVVSQVRIRREVRCRPR
jgi:hypothetical protein